MVSGSLFGALGASAVALVYGDKIGRKGELQVFNALRRPYLVYIRTPNFVCGVNRDPES